MRLRSFTFGTVLLAALPFGVGCEESVQDAREDVEDATIETEKEVMEEEQDVDEAVLEGQQKIEEEKSELRDAEVEEAREADPN
jgi:hypothetical protein